LRKNQQIRAKKYISQTNKRQNSDGIDVEYSEEFADHDDKIAQARAEKAEQRNKKR